MNAWLQILLFTHPVNIVCMVFFMNVRLAFFWTRLNCWGLRFLMFRTIRTLAWLAVRPIGTDATLLGSQEDLTPLSFYQVLKFLVPCPAKFEESVPLER
jgi:hypothetical protein